jgi:hypothetical protein
LAKGQHRCNTRHSSVNGAEPFNLAIRVRRARPEQMPHDAQVLAGLFESGEPVVMLRRR